MAERTTAEPSGIDWTKRLESGEPLTDKDLLQLAADIYNSWDLEEQQSSIELALPDALIALDHETERPEEGTYEAFSPYYSKNTRHGDIDQLELRCGATAESHMAYSVWYHTEEVDSPLAGSVVIPKGFTQVSLTDTQRLNIARALWQAQTHTVQIMDKTNSAEDSSAN